MKKIMKISCISISFLSALLVLTGCGQPQAKKTSKTAQIQTTVADVNKVSDFVTMGGYGKVRVRGYGLVVGLAGTGSSECPPDIRLYLQKYIKSKVGKSSINADELINSKDTAVVTVLGLLPEGSYQDQKFDVILSSLAGTQTVSLQGGRLLEADLKRSDAVATTPAIAVAEGMVFSPQDKDARIGYVLNGGKSLITQDVSLKMKKPDFVQASIIRDRINEKFGASTAVAENENIITLKFPPKYVDRQVHFLNLVSGLYVVKSAAEYEQITKLLVADLAQMKNPDQVELAIEAIGKTAAVDLLPLLNSNDENLRFRAARCLMNMTDMRGYDTLTQIALKSDSLKMDAIDTIAFASPRREASSFLQQFLYSNDFNIMFKTYQHLDRLNDVSISSKLVYARAGEFNIERIVRSGKKLIWAARSGNPKVVFFGAPIYAKSGIFVETASQHIMVTSEPNSEIITIIVRDPKTARVETMKSSLEVGLILGTLCQETIKKKEKVLQTGLGVPYSQGIEFLRIMCEKGAIDAEFVMGNEPEIMKSINENK